MNKFRAISYLLFVCVFSQALLAEDEIPVSVRSWTKDETQKIREVNISITAADGTQTTVGKEGESCSVTNSENLGGFPCCIDRTLKLEGDRCRKATSDASNMPSCEPPYELDSEALCSPGCDEYEGGPSEILVRVEVAAGMGGDFDDYFEIRCDQRLGVKEGLNCRVDCRRLMTRESFIVKPDGVWKKCDEPLNRLDGRTCDVSCPTRIGDVNEVVAKFTNPPPPPPPTPTPTVTSNPTIYPTKTATTNPTATVTNTVNPTPTPTGTPTPPPPTLTPTLTPTPGATATPPILTGN